MSGKTRSFRFADFFIVVVFLFIAVLSVNIFWLDLTQSIRLQNVEPAGVVIIKKNTVQRRLARRVLWDRLVTESPVYVGDLISVAEVSAATLNIEEHSIDLDENTLIRIMLSHDGVLQIVLRGGKLSVTSGPDAKRLNLDLNGYQVRTGPGTTLSSSVGDRGMSLWINSGSVTDEEGRELTSGSYISRSTDGTELTERAAVVTRPAPNARFVKSGSEPLTVNFEWSRINLSPDEALRLEIAADRNFSNVSQTVNNLDRQARASLGEGTWFWKLSFSDTILGEGRIVIAGAGPQLISPAQNSTYRYQSELPTLIYQWTETEDVSTYILEISDEPEFRNPKIRRQGSPSFYTDSSLGSGTWYWRVTAVLPPVYENRGANGAPSRTAAFRIEQGPPLPEDGSLADWLAMEAPPSMRSVEPSRPMPAPRPTPAPATRASPTPTQAAPAPARPAPRLTLSSPNDGLRIEGLTAMRQQTVFRWDCEVAVTRSRFVLSQNPNPLQGRAAVEINNPDRSVRVDRLGEGTWYWTVEAQTANGVTVRAQPRRLQVLPIPLLAAPQNLRPAANYRFRIEEIKSLERITFNWAAVQGANAYLFTLYSQTPNGLRQIVNADPQTQTSYSLEDFRLLDRGTFVWRVEAVNIGRGGVIEQRGRPAENNFVFDFPSPGPVRIEDTGILYGN